MKVIFGEKLALLAARDEIDKRLGYPKEPDFVGSNVTAPQPTLHAVDVFETPEKTFAMHAPGEVLLVCEDTEFQKTHEAVALAAIAETKELSAMVAKQSLADVVEVVVDGVAELAAFAEAKASLEAAPVEESAEVILETEVKK